MKLYYFSSFSGGNFDSDQEKWVSISQLSKYAIPTAFKKLFSLMESGQKEITLSCREKVLPVILSELNKITFRNEKVIK